MTRRTILLTGITGFIGGALAARWAAAGVRVLAVVRAPTVTAGRDRVVESVARFIGAERASDFTAGAVTVIPGDLADPDLFRNPLFDTATHVVHAAACTSFVSTQRAWRSNVEATRLLAERMCEAPRLERFLHVGTAYSCGIGPKRVALESDAPRDGDEYVTEYSRTKAVAETLLRGFRNRLPVVIARPSAVIGHTKLGVAPSTSLYWYYRALAELGAGPFQRDDRRDIVPVCWASEALDFLLTLPRPQFDTYHLSAGRPGAERVSDIVTTFGPTRGWAHRTPVELSALHLAGPPFARNDEEGRAVARGIAACAKFGALGVDAFDNLRLLADGFRQPPRFTSYLPRCIETAGAATIYAQMVDGV